MVKDQLVDIAQFNGKFSSWHEADTILECIISPRSENKREVIVGDEDLQLMSKAFIKYRAFGACNSPFPTQTF